MMSATACLFSGNKTNPRRSFQNLAAKPPLPSPWIITSPAGVVGHKDFVIARIKNVSPAATRATTLELYLRAPAPGAVVGKAELVGSTKVPASPRGGDVTVSVAAERDFIVPKSGGGLRDVGIKLPIKLKKTQKQTANFKALIPFSLKIKGSNEEVGFGTSRAAGGTIKIPGKT